MRLQTIKDNIQKAQNEMIPPMGMIEAVSNGLLEYSGGKKHHDISAELTHIITSARFVSIKIKDLKDRMNMDQSQLELNSIWFFQRKTLKQIVDVMQMYAEAQKVQISLECEEDQSTELLGDVDRIQQVLMNLLSNAIDRSPEGG